MCCRYAIRTCMPCCAEMMRNRSSHQVSFLTRTSSITLTRGVSLKTEAVGYDNYNSTVEHNSQYCNLITEKDESTLWIINKKKTFYAGVVSVCSKVTGSNSTEPNMPKKRTLWNMFCRTKQYSYRIRSMDVNFFMISKISRLTWQAQLKVSTTVDQFSGCLERTAEATKNLLFGVEWSEYRHGIKWNT